MRVEIRDHNANVLWNSHSHANFDVDSKGRLLAISKWNVFGRLFKWIRNLNGAVTDKVNQTVASTFDAIAEVNNQADAKKIYVRDQEWGVNALFFDATAAYSPYYPAPDLAHKILSTPHIDRTVRDAALRVRDQNNLYDVKKDWDAWI